MNPNVKAWVGLTVLALVMAALLLLSAGTLRYWQAWLYFAVFFGASVFHTLYLMKHDPALLHRRLKGGPLALAVATAAHRLLGAFAFPGDYALVLLLGALLLLISVLSFVSVGESEAPATRDKGVSFYGFLLRGLHIYSDDRRFRLFVCARWFDGAAAMALPFYIIEVQAAGAPAAWVAVLLAAQTAGALLSNPLWGWWGDRLGKRELLEATAALAAAPGLLPLAASLRPPAAADVPLAWFTAVFALLGAAGNGGTIATSWRFHGTRIVPPTAATSMRWSHRPLSCRWLAPR